MTTTPLPTRPLGSSGLDITTVGFGAWAVGGGGWAFGWGPQDDDESLAAMRHALELGVNWIDTAAVYGLGHSEEVVGRLLRDLPAGRPAATSSPSAAWSGTSATGWRRRVADARARLDPARSARPRCAGSASSASTSTSSTGPTTVGTPVEDSWAAMARLVEEGKVRAAGRLQLRRRRCSSAARRSATSTRCSRRSRSSGARPPADEIPWCAAHGTGVIVLQPDAVRPADRPLRRRARRRAGADDDWRRRSPEFRPPQARAQPRASRRAAADRAPARDDRVGGRGGLDARLARRDRRHRRRALGEPGGRLDRAPPRSTSRPADLDEIAAALERTGAGTGPSPPGGGRQPPGTRRRDRLASAGARKLSAHARSRRSLRAAPSLMAASHTELRVAGAVVTYRLYDVGYALDLEHAARLVEGQATGRTRPTRGEAKALVIAQPPLTLALGPGGAPRRRRRGPPREMSACCYDFGVISLRLRGAAARWRPWADLVALARAARARGPRRRVRPRAVRC